MSRISCAFACRYPAQLRTGYSTSQSLRPSCSSPSDKPIVTKDLRAPGVRIEEIMLRALHVHQRAANYGREQAAAATGSAEQIQQWKKFGLVTGSQLAS